MKSGIIDKLLKSNEPSIRFKTRVNVLGEDPGSKEIKKLQEEVRKSPVVRKLLTNQNRSGWSLSARNIYDKWQGAHWGTGIPCRYRLSPRDSSLFPARDEVLDFWLQDFFIRNSKLIQSRKPTKRMAFPLCREDTGDVLPSRAMHCIPCLSWV